METFIVEYGAWTAMLCIFVVFPALGFWLDREKIIRHWKCKKRRKRG